LSFHRHATPPLLPPFPTRRSSDLCAFLGEEPSFCSTLAPGPAANQYDFAIESSHVSIPPYNKLCHKIDTAPGNLQEYHRCTPSQDRKSTRLNSSHVSISYAVFCLK